VEYSIRVREVQAKPIGVIRRRACQSELSRVVPEGCGIVWNYFRSLEPPRKPQPGRHIAIYLDGEINLEVGVEVTAPFEGDGTVVCSHTPAGLAATTVHVGDYGKLGNAHQAILTWCDQNGYRLAGPSWEIYGHSTDDPTQVSTDIYYLVTECGTGD
jgi:effector-binding domain-containing protein